MPDQRILFSKSGTAKYISHLDLMHTMERAFLRAGITIRHTAGFHPHPYVLSLINISEPTRHSQIADAGLGV